MWQCMNFLILRFLNQYSGIKQELQTLVLYIKYLEQFLERTYINEQLKN